MTELNYADVKPGDLITVRYPSGTTITGFMDSFGRNDSIEDMPFVIAVDGSLFEDLVLVYHAPGPPAWDREGVKYAVDSDDDIWVRVALGWCCTKAGRTMDSREVEDEYGPCRALIPQDVA